MPIKNNFAIIEAGNHRECLEGLCLVLNDIQVQADFYVPQGMLAYLKKAYPEQKFIGLDKNILKSVLESGEYKLILLETIQKYYANIAAARFASPTYLRIHNLNTWFRNLQLYWRDPLLAAKTFIKDGLLDNELFARKRILSKVSGVNFCDSSMQEFYRQKVARKFEVLELPAHYYDQSYSIDEQTNARVIITITGAIERKRKDYQVVVKALQLVPLEIRQKLCLVLLGKNESAYSQQIIAQLAEIPGLELVSFTQRVPEETFNKFLKKTDYLLAPINVETNYSCFVEYYGQTKVSGSINDSVRYGVPLIVPSAYHTPSYLAGSLKQYKNYKELAEVLKQITAVGQDKALYQNQLIKYNKQIATKLKTELAKFGVK